LCSPSLRFALSAPLQGWAIPLGLTLATPDLAGHAGVALRNPNSISERKKIRMNINRVTLCGNIGKDVHSSPTQNGRNMTRFSVATSKRYKDANGDWQEKTEWHRCVCYRPTADYAAKLQTGSHVFIEGELIHRDYERTIDTESGPVKVPWPNTEILIDSLSVLDPKGKQERRGAT
jgi:single-strand DNA-binding protein